MFSLIWVNKCFHPVLYTSCPETPRRSFGSSSCLIWIFTASADDASPCKTRTLMSCLFFKRLIQWSDALKVSSPSLAAIDSAFAVIISSVKQALRDSQRRTHANNSSSNSGKWVPWKLFAANLKGLISTWTACSSFSAGRHENLCIRHVWQPLKYLRAPRDFAITL